MVSYVHVFRQVVPLRVEGAGSVVAGVAPSDISLAAPGIVTVFTVRAGQAVDEGEVLALVMPDPLSVAVLRKAGNAVHAAGAARDHVAALLAQHLATKADLAAASQNLQDMQTDFAALQATGTGTQRRLVAPFAGTITAISAAPGSLLPAGTAVFQLAAASGLSILAGVAEADALQIRQGDTARITLLNTGVQLSATVAQRATMLNPQTGLIDVTLLPAGAVTLGEPVAVTITTGSVAAFQVPSAAVLSDAEGDYVFLLDHRNIAHRKDVQVIESESGTSVLAPDFDAGMRLATTGAYQLSDGMTATLQGIAP